MANNKTKSIFKIIGKIFLWLFVLQFVYIIFCKWINPPITLTQIGSVIQGNGLQRSYVNIDAISPEVKLAVMASEDQIFLDHDGFDIRAIKRAQKYNKRHPNKVRGASTISQQVAKNIFLWQGRSYFRKGLEVYFTFMIEKLWSKERILELYLNEDEMGKGVFGVQQAAVINFNKNARNLSRAESAMIAACLPNPKVYTIKPMSRYVSLRYPNIMHQMSNLEGDEDIQDFIK